MICNMGIHLDPVEKEECEHLKTLKLSAAGLPLSSIQQLCHTGNNIFASEHTMNAIQMKGLLHSCVKKQKAADHIIIYSITCFVKGT